MGDAAIPVDPRSISELASALARLLKDEVLREELRRQEGYQQVQRFTWSNSAAKWLAIYQLLLSGAPVSTDEIKLEMSSL